MKIARDAIIIAWMKFGNDIKREPLLTVLLIAISGGFPLVILWAYVGPSAAPHVLVGAMVFNLGYMAMIAASQDIIWDKYVKMREMIVAMPVSPLSYSFGVALGSLLYSFPGMIVYMFLLYHLSNISLLSIAVIFPVLMATWISLSTMGFTISTLLYNSTPYRVNSVSNLLSFLIAFLPPVYYPAEALGSLSWLASFLPTSSAALLIRQSIGISSMSGPMIAMSWSSLLVYALAFSLIVIKKTKWREP